MGISAVGPRLLSEWFRIETGTRYTLVPYRGSGPAVQDLASGQIDLFFGTPDLLSLARAGSIKVHAATSDTRLAIAPEVPTFAELGLPKISWSAWYRLFAPAGRIELKRRASARLGCGPASPTFSRARNKHPRCSARL